MSNFLQIFFLDFLAVFGHDSVVLVDLGGRGVFFVGLIWSLEFSVHVMIIVVIGFFFG